MNKDKCTGKDKTCFEEPKCDCASYSNTCNAKCKEFGSTYYVHDM